MTEQAKTQEQRFDAAWTSTTTLPAMHSAQEGREVTRPDRDHCPRCGHYMPQNLAGTERVHDCDRTAPLDGLPPTLYACPICGGHGASRWGCWGSPEHPHKHAYMEPVHELVRRLHALDEEQRNAQEDRGAEAPCSATLHHGPGHQSSTRCRLRGPHEEHEAIYGSDQQVAWWRDGQYQRALEAAGIPRERWGKWVNEGTAMTGFFDEPPREEEA